MKTRIASVWKLNIAWKTTMAHGAHIPNHGSRASIAVLACQVTIVTSSLFNFQRRRRHITSRDGHCIMVAVPVDHQHRTKRLIDISTDPTRLKMTLFYPIHVWQVLLGRIDRKMAGMEMRVPLFRKIVWRYLPFPGIVNWVLGVGGGVAPGLRSSCNITQGPFSCPSPSKSLYCSTCPATNGIR